ncbi:Uncharacterized protein TCM_024561 [Theobroma cacao]|uniref:Retrotransposon gag domain-containing protein n=1 Tax=Theobroma cacao TaxID=3641 RepID=A0A061EVT6_THECC|nr:Uncharacterized protein TCM_024561 [Theobroma cacao]
MKGQIAKLMEMVEHLNEANRIHPQEFQSLQTEPHLKQPLNESQFDLYRSNIFLSDPSKNQGLGKVMKGMDELNMQMIELKDSISKIGSLGPTQPSSSGLPPSTYLQLTIFRPTFQPMNIGLRPNHLVAAMPMKPPYPKWYNLNTRCDYHGGVMGHSIEDCTAFKHSSWKDLARAFLIQYKHDMDIASNRLSLQNMEKRDIESFKEYAQRWIDVAAQVQSPLTEKETTMLFIGTLQPPYYDKLIGNATKNFTDIVISGEMIENAIKKGEIGENSVSNMENCIASKKRKEELQVITREGQPWNQYFSPVPIKTVPNPSARNYDPNAKCDYHMRTIGHSIEKCRQLNEKIEILIKDGTLTFELMEHWKSTLP